MAFGWAAVSWGPFFCAGFAMFPLLLLRFVFSISWFWFAFRFLSPLWFPFASPLFVVLCGLRPAFSGGLSASGRLPLLFTVYGSRGPFVPFRSGWVLCSPAVPFVWVFCGRLCFGFFVCFRAGLPLARSSLLLLLGSFVCQVRFFGPFGFLSFCLCFGLWTSLACACLASGFSVSLLRCF